MTSSSSPAPRTSVAFPSSCCDAFPCCVAASASRLAFISASAAAVSRCFLFATYFLLDVLFNEVFVEACLLQSVKFLAVEFIQLRVDVLDSVLGPRNNNVLNRID